jgi:hypothetical protein
LFPALRIPSQSMNWGGRPLIQPGQLTQPWSNLDSSFPRLHPSSSFMSPPASLSVIPRLPESYDNFDNRPPPPLLMLNVKRESQTNHGDHLDLDAEAFVSGSSSSGPKPVARKSYEISNDEFLEDADSDEEVQTKRGKLSDGSYRRMWKPEEYKLLIDTYQSGMDVASVTAQLQMPTATARTILSKFRKNSGYTAPKKRGGAFRLFAEKQEMMLSLMEWFLDGHVNAPLREMLIFLKTKFNKVPCKSTVATWLDHTVVVMPAMTPPVWMIVVCSCPADDCR